MLSVSIPRLRGNRLRTSEVRPRRVEEWLESLPRADARECAHLLYQALYAQNRIALESKNRLVLMELYRQPVSLTVDTLQQTYRMTSFPLSERERELVDFVRQLLTELGNGYKIVANDLLREGKKRSHHSELVTSIQRAIHFLGRALLNSYQAYVAAPAGAWREIHQLYQYAEINDLLNYPVAVEDTVTQDGLATVSETYERLLIVSAANPYGLLQGECVRLYDSIPLWEGEAEISAAPPMTETAARFVIDLHSDIPPVPVDKTSARTSSETLRFVNLIEVVRDIHRMLKGLEKDSTQRAVQSVVPGVNPAYTEMLRRVGRVLGGVKTRRQSHRTPREGGIPICRGVNAIHYYANGEQTIPVHSPAAAATTNPEHAGNDETAPGDAAQPSPWRVSEAHPRLHACKSKDESATGIRLFVTDGSDLQIRVGDVIGLQHPTPERWRAGVVRWIRSASNEVMEMGVQLLGPDLVPVKVIRRLDAATTEYAPGLLVPANRALKQPESLLLRRGLYEPGVSLFFDDGSTEPTAVTPLGVLERSGSFDQLMLAAPQLH